MNANAESSVSSTIYVEYSITHLFMIHIRFIVYKMPRIKSLKETPHIADGYAYLYLDSSNPSFRLGKTSILDEKSAPGRTLNQIYKYNQTTDEDLAYGIYSDQPPPTGRLK